MCVYNIRIDIRNIHILCYALLISLSLSVYMYVYTEISLTPSYAAVVGSCWLESGGVYVTANIRGGGMYC